ncbi:hypothetical protein TcWFU_004839 [Taenia crassiceps]|uniref:Secreted protein n=1 Tax=Taenia crassiceps TaxID=6207 RepID=A0ABR4PYV8_9CEST
MTCALLSPSSPNALAFPFFALPLYDIAFSLPLRRWLAERLGSSTTHSSSSLHCGQNGSCAISRRFCCSKEKKKKRENMLLCPVDKSLQMWSRQSILHT